MTLGTSGNWRKYLAASILLACATFSMVMFLYEDTDLASSLPNSLLPDSHMSKTKFQTVMLPAGTLFPKWTLKTHLGGTVSEHWDTYQLKVSEIKKMPPYKPGSYKLTETSLFLADSNSECEGRGRTIELATDESLKLPLNLKNILEIFREEAETYGDAYNKHLLPVLEPFMSEEKYSKSWYRLSGSSVWLKDYGVHLVVSRLEVSELELRDHPRLSVPLAQIFDEDWNEIEDVRLVFPTSFVEDSPGFSVNDKQYHSYRFPRILPVPFDIGQVHKYWGAEDPRMILVRNKNGREEPVIVFNAFHVKSDIDKSVPDVEGKRSMFMSFPFQLQKGKQIEAADTQETQTQWFARTEQLKIEGQEETKIEKNWVPFVAGDKGVHEHVMYATSLEPLKIVKCDLWADADCTVEHSEDAESVGALRGGTPLFSFKRDDAEDTEYYVGFARAHLNGCGCGFKFYRPNLVVVVREKDTWRLALVSSFIDLGMEILPWTPEEKVCDRINAMIPNGIEFWDQEKDVMSVDVSISDTTVERVHLKGVLKALEEAEYSKKPGADGLSGPVKCALEASESFCKAYGEKHSEKTE